MGVRGVKNFPRQVKTRKTTCRCLRFFSNVNNSRTLQTSTAPLEIYAQGTTAASNQRGCPNSTSTPGKVGTGCQIRLAVKVGVAKVARRFLDPRGGVRYLSDVRKLIGLFFNYSSTFGGR